MPVWRLVVQYRVDFGNFSMEERKGNSVWDLSGEGEETIYLGLWGSICSPEKIPESNQVTALVRQQLRDR